MTRKLSIFYSYAAQDKPLRDKLANHLAVLEQQGLITSWHDRLITGGQEWASEISTYLNSAQIILLLISASFLASKYCYGIEMARALERQKNDNACVIPIILRHVDWQTAPFGKLQALPTKGDPVVGGSWRSEDEGFADIAKNIRKIVEEILLQQDGEAPLEGTEKRDQIIPGGLWISPQNGITIGNTVEFAALAYPTHPGDPAIQYVNFTVGWSGYWQIAGTVYPESGANVRVFKYTVKLSDLFIDHPIRAEAIQVSFDVYDQQGNKNLAPHGVRTVMYQPDKV